MLPNTANSKIPKTLSVFGLAMINVVAIDSLRNLPTDAIFGLSIITLYAIATLCFLLPCLFVTAELATHYPKTGGSYVWVREAFGKKWGFFNIWIQWVYNIAWYPTILSFVAASIAYLFAPELVNSKIYMVSMIIGMFTLATLLNSYGMQLSAWISVIGATVGTLIPMAFISLLAISWYWTGKPIALTLTSHQLLPDIHHWRDLALFGTILFSLMGIEMSAVHAEEVKNPKRDYPRALILSSALIVFSTVLAALAIAIVVPKNALNIVSGMNQAFDYFLIHFHLKWLSPIAIGMIVIGGFCGMATWVIGPTKALMVAAQEGCAPVLFAKTNRHGAPVGMLVAQALIVILLCAVYWFFPSIKSAYWVLSDLATELSLIFYILLFLAAIKLHKQLPNNEGAYVMPGGTIGNYFINGLGIVACVITMVLGFLAPDSIAVGNLWHYELTLIVGIVLLALPPFFLARKV